MPWTIHSHTKTSFTFGNNFKTDYKMKFTEEQLKTLSAWEDNFRTATKAQWARNPGTSGLRVIYDIYTKTTGDQRRFSDNCQHCILSLLTDCGKIYFADMEELARRKVEVSQEAAEPVKKVEVKTTKKSARKPKSKD